MRARVLSVSLILLTFMGVGCGPSNTLEPTPPVAVKAKVRYLGKPLTQGKITLEPTDGGHSATGEIQPDGGVVLTTFKEGDGALPGTHRVVFSGTDRPVKTKTDPHVKVEEGMTELLIDVK